MRFRSTAGAALGALALILALPTSASAAEGPFFYTYSGLDGSPQTGVLADPPSYECVTLPEVGNPSSSSSAHSPLNHTDAYATVYTGPHCDGDSFTLRPHGGHASERLKLRSVRFM
ncbi:hypothetical protein [Streptomyces flavofungini]|uniref:Uncharacterized protein n=1 Tax=Streptomyces flavofungini TaxID=68200 RepID=A0ABS0X5Y4_9ACTN|nr:hypothetical protein [Streptomyces flavofungini]MBJ3808426.1 hypothetical protein [Streptomyces flavofungini]GHC69505.1 hypothetical protein GCM10010349_44340 [Streptomyces flavofungini]